MAAINSQPPEMAMWPIPKLFWALCFVLCKLCILVMLFCVLYVLSIAFKLYIIVHICLIGDNSVNFGRSPSEVLNLHKFRS